MAQALKANLWKMYIFKFLVQLHFISAVLVPFFTDWGGISFTQIMILQSWFMFWIFLFEVPTGTVADYLGRKHSLILASVANILAVIVYASVPNFYVFLIGEFLWALSYALLSGAEEALVYDTLKKIKDSKKSKQVFAKLESFGLAGIMVGAPIGSVIAFLFGLRAPMILSVIPLTAALFVALALREPKISKTSKQKRYKEILREGVSFFCKSKVLQILALDMIVISSVGYFLIWLYQPMLKQAGISIAYFGIVHALFVISEIVIMNSYAKLEKILRSKKRVLFFSAFIPGVMFIVGGLTTYSLVVPLIIIIAGGFSLSRRPLLISYMNKYISSPKRATVLSTISMFRRLALVVTNPIVGLLVDWSLSYTLIILGIVAVIFSFVSKVEENHLID
jgi:MFS family permease